MRDIFDCNGTYGGRFAVALKAFYCARNCRKLEFKLGHLLLHLFFAADENRLYELYIPALKYLTYLLKTHTKLFHVLNHIKTGILAYAVISVSGFFVGKAGFYEPYLIVKPQCGYRNVVYFSHFAYA